MSVAERTIFREGAVEAYRRRVERDVVPRLSFSLIVACSWLLLAVLVAGAVVAWSVHVPSYVGVSGVVLTRADGNRAHGDKSRLALVFAPPRSGAVRAGQRVHAQLGSSGTYVEGVVAEVGSGLVGADAASIRYRLDGGAGLPSEPSRPVTVRLRTALPARAYGGTRVTARIEVGSRRLLSLFPGVGKLFGG